MLSMPNELSAVRFADMLTKFVTSSKVSTKFTTCAIRGDRPMIVVVKGATP